MNAAALYISYFGLREPLVQTQVLPYLRQVGASGVSFTLLTFEPAHPKWTKDELARMETMLQRDGIEWVRRRYHKRMSLLATTWDILAGAATAVHIVRRRGVRVIHARSHVAAVVGAIAKRLTGAKLLFDIRGLMAAEYVSGGNWRPGGFLFRLTKAAERWLIRHSDGFVVLTRKARDFLFSDARVLAGRPLEVIPTCVDPERFAAAATLRDVVRAELGIGERVVFVALGSLGSWYRTADLADLLAAAYRADPATFVLCLTHSQPDILVGRLLALGVPRDSMLVRRVAPEDVPRYLVAADVAISFCESGVAKVGSSPTRLGEYLASGLPVIQSGGIGDIAEFIESRRVGVLVNRYGEHEYAAALAAIRELGRDPDIVRRCRAAALEEFDLAAVGGARYRRLYEALFQPS